MRWSIRGFPWRTVATILLLSAGILAGISYQSGQASGAASTSPDVAMRPLAQAGTVVPLPTATSAAMNPAGTPAARTGSQGGVLFYDDFTDPKSGWPDNVELENYYIGYHEPDHYHLEVHAPQDRALVRVPRMTFTDFTVESKVLVEPNNTAKTGDFRYGLFFRRSGNQYYAFVVSPRSGSWYALKSSSTGLTTLAQGTNDSIHGLTAEDTLRVDAKGASFFFHINGEALGQVTDAAYTTGDAGFLVETLDSPRTHIHFGETTIREAEVAQLTCAIITYALNVRTGPGITNPSMGIVRRGAQLELFGRDARGQWINVRFPGSDRMGWISAAPTFVTCSVAIDELPVRQP